MVGPENDRETLLQATLRPKPLPLRASTFRVALLPVLVPFLVYFLCLPQHLTGDRAGELLTAATLSSQPSAPYHAAWLWILKLTEYCIPWGNPVWRAGLVSAVCAACACGLLTLWLRQQDVGRRAAVLAGLGLAFGLSHWRHAVTPGVASFLVCTQLGALVLLYQWLATHQHRWLPGMTFLWGVGLSLHPSSWIPIVGGLALLARRLPSRREKRSWVLAFLAFSAGWAPHFWNLSQWDARASLALTADLSLWELQHAVVHWTELGRTLLEEHVWLGPLGLFALWFGRRRAGNVLLLVFLISAALLLVASPLWNLVSPGLRREPWLFLGPAWIAIAALGGIALDGVLQRYGNGTGARPHIVSALAACLPLILLAHHSRQNDYTQYFYLEDLTTEVLDSIAPRGVLFVGGDPATPAIQYALGTLGKRPDVDLESDPTRLESWPPERPVYGLRRFPTQPTNQWVAHGLVFRLERADSTPEGTGSGLGVIREVGWDAFRNATWNARDDDNGEPPLRADRSARAVLLRYYETLARQERKNGRSQRADELDQRILSLTD